MPNSLKIHYFITLILAIILSIFLYTIFRPFHRYAVFAGYSPNGTIEPYVITYLEELNKVTDGIVYITDSPLSPQELAKLNHINIIFHYHSPHHEYDWGSYKRGFHYLKIKGYLKNTDELIFANDSTYAPITSFAPMFDTMQRRSDLDFWGNTKNTHFNTHLQSYFLVFRNKVINSPQFEKFMYSVTKLPDHSLYVLQYEIVLTPYLASLGYKYDSYIPYEKLSYLPLPDKNSYPLTLIRNFHNQFLKRRTFTEKLTISENIDELLSYLKLNHPHTYQNILSAHHPHLQHLKD